MNPMAEWIRVEDRLPEDVYSVVMSDGKSVAVGWYGVAATKWRAEFYDKREFNLESVTHWQPLPAAPEVNDG